MDTDSYDYGGLDFALREPGLVEDLRGEESTAESAPDAAESLLQQALNSFDAARRADEAAVACHIRVGGEGGELLAGRQVQDRLSATLRNADCCIPAGNSDYVVMFANCDAATALKRLGLLLRLVTLSSQGAPVWAGVAPFTGQSCMDSVRTARLACELATYQSAGHIEVIEL